MRFGKVWILDGKIIDPKEIEIIYEGEGKIKILYKGEEKNKEWKVRE